MTPVLAMWACLGGSALCLAVALKLWVAKTNRAPHQDEYDNVMGGD